MLGGCSVSPCCGKVLPPLLRQVHRRAAPAALASAGIVREKVVSSESARQESLCHVLALPPQLQACAVAQQPPVPCILQSG